MSGNDKRQHEGSVRPTGWRVPLVIVIITGAISYVIVEQTYGALPVLPWSAIPTLALLAAAEAIAAWHTRRRIRRVPGTDPVEPLTVARLVALAKASAVCAAGVIGVFAGMGLSLLDRLSVPTPRADALTAVGYLLAGALLLVAALFLEYACRVPDDEENPEDPTQTA